MHAYIHMVVYVYVWMSFGQNMGIDIDVLHTYLCYECVYVIYICIYIGILNYHPSTHPPARVLMPSPKGIISIIKTTFSNTTYMSKYVRLKVFSFRPFN